MSTETTTSVCRLDLIVSTPIAPDLTTAEFVTRMVETGRGLQRHATHVAALVDGGWEMSPPRADADGEFTDLVFTFRKRYASVEDAKADLERLGIRSALNTDAWVGAWSLGWNEDAERGVERWYEV